MDSSLRLILFGGKGGVGKTTCAAATAVYMAGSFPEKPLLLVSTDPAHSLKDSFGVSDIPRNLRVLEFAVQEYLGDFKEAHGPKLREIARRGTFLDDEDIQRFLDLSLPGMDELLALLEISRWVEDPSDYACIIVDTAPTGHTLRLLSMPELLENWLGALDSLLAKHRYMKQVFSGFNQPDELDEFIDELGGSVERMQTLFKDPLRCRFIPVMIPEELSIRETLTLLRALDRLEIPVSQVVINRLRPDYNCTICATERAREMRRLNRLPKKFSKYSLWGVPLYPHEVRGLQNLEAFWTQAEELPFRPGSRRSRRGKADKEVRLQLQDALKLVENAARSPSPEMIFLLFAGKGGVGKTTVACSTAVRLARDFPERRVLLFSTDPAHSLADCLDMRVGPSPTHILDGLWAIEIDSQAEFDSLKKQYHEELESFLDSVFQNIDLTFDREVMEKILDLSPPGLDEIMALMRIMDLLGQGSYDLFILDSAPTGHLIRLLELPELVDQWLKAFFELFLKYKHVFGLPRVADRLIRMSKELRRLRALLVDSKRSALYGVSILTEMAFEETKDLFAACERMKINVPALFLNMVTPESDCPLCSALHSRESEIEVGFSESFPGLHRTLVYRQEDEPRGVKRLESLGKALYVPYRP